MFALRAVTRYFYDSLVGKIGLKGSWHKIFCSFKWPIVANWWGSAFVRYRSLKIPIQISIGCIGKIDADPRCFFFSVGVVDGGWHGAYGWSNNPTPLARKMPSWLFKYWWASLASKKGKITKLYFWGHFYSFLHVNGKLCNSSCLGAVLYL